MTHESLGHQEEGGRGIIRLSKRGWAACGDEEGQRRGSLAGALCSRPPLSAGQKPRRFSSAQRGSFSICSNEGSSGQRVSGVGDLVGAVCAGRGGALCQWGRGGGLLGGAAVRGPAPRRATPAAHQALLVQEGEVVLAQVDQRGHLLVERQHLELPLSQVKESLHEALQAHACGQREQR